MSRQHPNPSATHKNGPRFHSCESCWSLVLWACRSALPPRLPLSLPSRRPLAPREGGRTHNQQSLLLSSSPLSSSVLSSSSSNSVTNFLNFFSLQVNSGSIDLMHTGLSNFKCIFLGVNNKDSCYSAMNTTILRGYDSAYCAISGRTI